MQMYFCREGALARVGALALRATVQHASAPSSDMPLPLSCFCPRAWDSLRSATRARSLVLFYKGRCLMQEGVAPAGQVGRWAAHCLARFSLGAVRWVSCGPFMPQDGRCAA